jgi:hypothetical protein
MQAFFRYQGKPVLSSFLGTDSTSQPQWANGTDGTNFTSWEQTYIGSLNYWAGAAPTPDINGTNNLARINLANGKPIVVDLSGGRYWAMHGNPDSINTLNTTAANAQIRMAGRNSAKPDIRHGSVMERFRGVLDFPNRCHSPYT